MPPPASLDDARGPELASSPPVPSHPQLLTRKCRTTPEPTTRRARSRQQLGPTRQRARRRNLAAHVISIALMVVRIAVASVYIVIGRRSGENRTSMLAATDANRWAPGPVDREKS